LLQVRLFNLRRVAKMRELNPEDVDHLVALRGMVRGEWKTGTGRMLC
jgi:DNA replicative helicase MCM subunit Mcm2 (Cdc46/Mcm family)